jgi:DNA helicase TIP49 (TBP-interacting protein)
VSNLLEAEPAAMRQRLTDRPRYALQLLTPASILATLAGRNHIEVEDIGEMGELFLDAKTSAGMISA